MYDVTKRIMDFLFALAAGILLSPIIVLLIIWIKLDSEGPVLFQQKRVGKDKHHFMILKFRTMSIHTPKDAPTHLLENPEQYITRAGRFLRKSSLDELPQLWNILKGDMGLVGPRPALWNQFDLIEERDRYHVNSIRPGLTGWAQINGRDECPIELKAKLDGEYIEQQSFRMDIKCIFLTAVQVVTSKDVVEGKSIK